MKRKNRISQLTLELYYKGLATYKERRQVEKALKTDIEVQNRYKAIQESEKEFRKSFSNELNRLELQKIPPAPISKRKKIAIGILIAAVLLCALIPTFLYLKHSGSNKKNEITKSSNTEIEDNSELDDDDELMLVSYEPILGTIIQTGEQNSGNSAPYEQEKDITYYPYATSISVNQYANRQLIRVVIPNRIRLIEKNAFTDNPLISVSISENVDVNDEAIPGNFAKAYNNYGKAAGTYTRPNTNSEAWEKK